MFKPFLLLIFFAVAASAYMYNDNSKLDKAVMARDIRMCLLPKHSFIMARCFKLTAEVEKQDCMDTPHANLKKECFERLAKNSDLVRDEIIKPNFNGVFIFIRYLFFLNFMAYIVFSMFGFSLHPRQKIYYLEDLFMKVFSRRDDEKMPVIEVIFYYSLSNIILIVMMGFLEFISIAMMST